MKSLTKIFTLVFALLTFTRFTSMAQSGTIELIEYKQIGMTGGEWDDWPTGWNNYKQEGRSNPTIQITRMGQDPYVYNLRYVVDGKMVANFDVTYDPATTTKMRKEWNDQYTNCYVDDEGDYIYVKATSLDHLCQNPEKWAELENSMIYMWIFSGKEAVVVR